MPYQNKPSSYISVRRFQVLTECEVVRWPEGNREWATWCHHHHHHFTFTSIPLSRISLTKSLAVRESVLTCYAQVVFWDNGFPLPLGIVVGDNRIVSH